MADPEVKTDAPQKKKNPNRLMVDEATNDDNSVVALNLATMEELQYKFLQFGRVGNQ